MKEAEFMYVCMLKDWRRKWQPTPAFLPGESHGKRSLAGYNPWGCKESDTTEGLKTATMLKEKVYENSVYFVITIATLKGLFF